MRLIDLFTPAEFAVVLRGAGRMGFAPNSPEVLAWNEEISPYLDILRSLGFFHECSNETIAYMVTIFRATDATVRYVTEELNRPMKSLTKVENSSLFDAVAYDHETQELTVKFKSSGDIYVYEGVTPDDWRELCLAESKGGHFVKHIRNNFPYRKVDDETDDVAESASPNASSQKT